MPDVSPTLLHGNSTQEWNSAHARLREDQAVWNCLAFAGLQCDGQGGLVEYRHCPSCKSTIARPISAEAAMQIFAQHAALLLRSAEMLDAIPPRVALCTDDGPLGPDVL